MIRNAPKRKASGPLKSKNSWTSQMPTSLVHLSRILISSKVWVVKKVFSLLFTPLWIRVSTLIPRRKEMISTITTSRNPHNLLASVSFVMRSYKISCSRFCSSVQLFPWQLTWLPPNPKTGVQLGLNLLLCSQLSPLLPFSLHGKIPLRKPNSLITSRLRRTPKRLELLDMAKLHLKNSTETSSLLVISLRSKLVSTSPSMVSALSLLVSNLTSLP